MKSIHIIIGGILMGLLAGCSEDARSSFWRDYDPIGDAIDDSLEKSRKKRVVDYYKDKGATHKEATRMANEDKFWSGGASQYTPLEKHQWENPDYPER